MIIVEKVCDFFSLIDKEAVIESWLYLGCEFQDCFKYLKKLDEKLPTENCVLKKIKFNF